MASSASVTAAKLSSLAMFNLLQQKAVHGAGNHARHFQHPRL